MADSHAGEYLPAIPAEVLDVLAGCEVIVHAGDITDPGALSDLETVAPVVAVCGDHDRPLASHLLARDHVLEIGGRTIGVTHGHRSRPLEYLARICTFLARRLVDLGLDRHLIRRLGRRDCIVHGHLHLPRNRQVGATTIFSPGAVFTVEHEPAGVHAGLSGRAVDRFRRSLPRAERQAAVGLIEIDRRGIAARRQVLDRPLRGPA